ncbi:MAG: bifunctional methylenetetrahydrofolate dehydrogenase/methenyltetrahydrofolate cyclohydrolase FolD [Chloroflexi bacterium]|nr:bifunctional methylenetetrahydrofolate dehydrogenase/methenyltetrahydrofolate cyclohydrolase FolD [Chloroflexota bacterium]MDA1004108.1 bifunctional methylenetetrahydrofolate dehydrogenase/methenyltetrahydrofolate cyclohydrolase FolD [Chloroflexota bacterium]MQC28028.1 bifunctional methylenetetrahydrofolate dehydrogenase/methenyltetrahydrofolate cyclohydrolase FolD [Chloroflexota bacterium]
MSARIIDGNAVAAEIRGEVAREVTAWIAAGRARPHLTAVLVGDDPASATYVRGKRRDCEEVGFSSETLTLPAATTQAELLTHVARLNADPTVTGMIVQMPLPPQIDEHAVMAAISPDKDADGLTPTSLGLLLQGRPRFVPATPSGVQQLLMRSGIDPAGKRVVVVGRSMLVGRPLAMLLAAKADGANATVTMAHTGTRDLAAVTREAEILIVAAGRPRMVTAEMVTPGAVVIDVGVNRIDDPTRKSGSRLVGDVDYEPVAAIASAITPVPGGVGPMTRAMLLVNTLRAARD